jgi:hypothetical protein
MPDAVKKSIDRPNMVVYRSLPLCIDRVSWRPRSCAQPKLRMQSIDRHTWDLASWRPRPLLPPQAAAGRNSDLHMALLHCALASDVANVAAMIMPTKLRRRCNSRGRWSWSTTLAKPATGGEMPDDWDGYSVRDSDHDLCCIFG